MAWSFFSIELLFPFAKNEALHTRLRDHLRAGPLSATPQEKWRHTVEASGMLGDALSSARRGCWEYFDNEEAASMYDDWMRPMVDESRQPGPASEDGDGPRYFTFTILFRMVKGSATDVALRTACNKPEGMLWRRSTFRGILRTLGQVSFASVSRDAMYLMPRDDSYGWTDVDLKRDFMGYLRAIQD